jgi:coenzyme F420-0:L-glutamate ligase/coenzyme F420-1:gamma-L-glutamate ligase
VFPEKVFYNLNMGKTGTQPLILTPLNGVPDIQPGNPLAAIILEAINNQNIGVEDNDILVLAQKVVSKTENRFFNYANLKISPQAAELASICGKDPQFVELVLSESVRVVRVAPGLLIVEHHSGFISANAGIDHSNIGKKDLPGEKWALLIPLDADRSAENLKSEFLKATGKSIGVLIIDSHGRPWRIGTVGVSIGFAGLPALVDMRGRKDLYGRVLESTVICAVDELAAAASLVMGQADEAIPVVHVSGFPYPLGNGNLRELLRPKEIDLFK